ncbi:C40 family peptidase [Tropicimonas sp. IMCC34011]|uniref:C40 family peptidase n=1 Tax=Tropicimonas sp. IMCC34011 TaxID=2248759 RepID=UPI000E289444|nr:NlpC/P60 family protein [Tropicimonas sp. IMCC34011]
MSRPHDRRLTPANGRVAAEELRGEVDADRFVRGDPASLAVPVADLLCAPGGSRDRQLLFGTPLRVLDRQEGIAFIQSGLDGYVGYVTEAALGPATEATHAVAARSAHLYSAPDIKSPELGWLPHGALLSCTPQDGRFHAGHGGYIVASHLREVDAPESDPAAVAERFLGTPYLWGGNGPLGIDCSGLVQAALVACGLPCPGDSDLQRISFPAADDAPRRGDLFFWKGHVAMAVSPDRIIHANAHSMSVAYEGLAEAIARIEAQGDGPVTAHARPNNRSISDSFSST